MQYVQQRPWEQASRISAFENAFASLPEADSFQLRWGCALRDRKDIDIAPGTVASRVDRGLETQRRNEGVAKLFREAADSILLYIEILQSRDRTCLC